MDRRLSCIFPLKMAAFYDLYFIIEFDAIFSALFSISGCCLLESPSHYGGLEPLLVPLHWFKVPCQLLFDSQPVKRVAASLHQVCMSSR